MTDIRVEFLTRLASSIANTNKSNLLLKSFYLMRCRKLVNDTDLLQKYFPIGHTCSYCGITWSKDECIMNVRPKRITKSQKRNTKTSKEVAKNGKPLKKKKTLITSNQLEKLCLLCKHRTFINLVKPVKQYVLENKETRKVNMSESTRDSNNIVSKTKDFIQNSKNKKLLKKEMNVYSSTKDVFSLLNKTNSVIVNKPKVVRTNKRKKDKFAGLRREAVLAMANIKEQKESKNMNDKLNLFLKPSN